MSKPIHPAALLRARDRNGTRRALPPNTVRLRLGSQRGCPLGRLGRDWTAGFHPGAEAAIDMTAIYEPCLLCGLGRHGRTLAIGTIEDDSLARCGSQLVEQAARRDPLSEIRIGHVDRVGNDPVTLTLGAVAQVDERRPVGRRAPGPSRS